MNTNEKLLNWYGGNSCSNHSDFNLDFGLQKTSPAYNENSAKLLSSPCYYTNVCASDILPEIEIKNWETLKPLEVFNGTSNNNGIEAEEDDDDVICLESEPDYSQNMCRENEVSRCHSPKKLPTETNCDASEEDDHLYGSSQDDSLGKCANNLPVSDINKKSELPNQIVESFAQNNIGKMLDESSCDMRPSLADSDNRPLVHVFSVKDLSLDSFGANSNAAQCPDAPSDKQSFKESSSVSYCSDQLNFSSFFQDKLKSSDKEDSAVNLSTFSLERKSSGSFTFNKEEDIENTNNAARPESNSVSNCVEIIQLSSDSEDSFDGSTCKNITPNKAGQGNLFISQSFHLSKERMMPLLIPLSDTSNQEENNPKIEVPAPVLPEVIDVASSPEMPTLIPFTSEPEELRKCKSEGSNKSEESKKITVANGFTQCSVVLERLSFPGDCTIQKVSTVKESDFNAISVESLELKPIFSIPEIDVIDDLDFYSFCTKVEMDSFCDKYANSLSFTLSETKNSCSVQHDLDSKALIVPSKTNDITQIKGWRTKNFTADDCLSPISSDGKNDGNDEEDNQMEIPRTDSAAEKNDSLNDVRMILGNEDMIPMDQHKNDLPIRGADINIESVENKVEEKTSALNDNVSINHTNRKATVNTEVGDRKTGENKPVKGIYESSALEHFLKNESKLIVPFLEVTNPNIVPIPNDASILSVGNLRKIDQDINDLKSPFKRSPLKNENVTEVKKIKKEKKPQRRSTTHGGLKLEDDGGDDDSIACKYKVKKKSAMLLASNKVLKKTRQWNKHKIDASSDLQRLVLKIRKENSGLNREYKVSEILSHATHFAKESKKPKAGQAVTMKLDGNQVKSAQEIIKGTKYSLEGKKKERVLLNEFIRNMNHLGTRNAVSILMSSRQAYFENKEITEKSLPSLIDTYTSFKLLLKKFKGSPPSSQKNKVRKKREPKTPLNKRSKSIGKVKSAVSVDNSDFASDSKTDVSSEEQCDSITSASSTPEFKSKRSIRLPARLMDSAVWAASEWVVPSMPFDNPHGNKKFKKGGLFVKNEEITAAEYAIRSLSSKDDSPLKKGNGFQSDKIADISGISQTSVGVLAPNLSDFIRQQNSGIEPLIVPDKKVKQSNESESIVKSQISTPRLKKKISQLNNGNKSVDFVPKRKYKKRNTQNNVPKLKLHNYTSEHEDLNMGQMSFDSEERDSDIKVIDPYPLDLTVNLPEDVQTIDATKDISNGRLLQNSDANTISSTNSKTESMIVLNSHEEMNHQNMMAIENRNVSPNLSIASVVSGHQSARNQNASVPIVNMLALTPEKTRVFSLKQCLQAAGAIPYATPCSSENLQQHAKNKSKKIIVQVSPRKLNDAKYAEGYKKLSALAKANAVSSATGPQGSPVITSVTSLSQQSAQKSTSDAVSFKTVMNGTQDVPVLVKVNPGYNTSDHVNETFNHPSGHVMKAARVGDFIFCDGFKSAKRFANQVVTVRPPICNSVYHSIQPKLDSSESSQSFDQSKPNISIANICDAKNVNSHVQANSMNFREENLPATDDQVMLKSKAPSTRNVSAEVDDGKLIDVESIAEEDYRFWREELLCNEAIQSGFNGSSMRIAGANNTLLSSASISSDSDSGDSSDDEVLVVVNRRNRITKEECQSKKNELEKQRREQIRQAAMQLRAVIGSKDEGRADALVEVLKKTKVWVRAVEAKHRALTFITRIMQKHRAALLRKYKLMMKGLSHEERRTEVEKTVKILRKEFPSKEPRESSPYPIHLPHHAIFREVDRNDDAQYEFQKILQDIGLCPPDNAKYSTQSGLLKIDMQEKWKRTFNPASSNRSLLDIDCSSNPDNANGSKTMDLIQCDGHVLSEPKITKAASTKKPREESPKASLLRTMLVSETSMEHLSSGQKIKATRRRRRRNNLDPDSKMSIKANLRNDQNTAKNADTAALNESSEKSTYNIPKRTTRSKKNLNESFDEDELEEPDKPVVFKRRRTPNKKKCDTTKSNDLEIIEPLNDIPEKRISSRNTPKNENTGDSAVVMKDSDSENELVIDEEPHVETVASSKEDSPKNTRKENAQGVASNPFRHWTVANLSAEKGSDTRKVSHRFMSPGMYQRLRMNRVKEKLAQKLNQRASLSKNLTGAYSFEIGQNSTQCATSCGGELKQIEPESKNCKQPPVVRTNASAKRARSGSETFSKNLGMTPAVALMSVEQKNDSLKLPPLMCGATVKLNSSSDCVSLGGLDSDAVLSFDEVPLSESSQGVASKSNSSFDNVDALTNGKTVETTNPVKLLHTTKFEGNWSHLYQTKSRKSQDDSVNSTSLTNHCHNESPIDLTNSRSNSSSALSKLSESVATSLNKAEIF